MGTILVTGGAGFIGCHVSGELLDRGADVVCLDDFNDYYDPAFKRANVEPFRTKPRWHLVEGDIRDASLVDDTYRRFGVTATVHLAARAGVRPSIRDPRLYQEVNGLGTLRAHRGSGQTPDRCGLLRPSREIRGSCDLLRKDPGGRSRQPRRCEGAQKS